MRKFWDENGLYFQGDKDLQTLLVMNEKNWRNSTDLMNIIYAAGLVARVDQQRLVDVAVICAELYLRYKKLKKDPKFRTLVRRNIEDERRTLLAVIEGKSPVGSGRGSYRSPVDYAVSCYCHASAARLVGEGGRYWQMGYYGTVSDAWFAAHGAAWFVPTRSGDHHEGMAEIARLITRDGGPLDWDTIENARLK